MKHLPKHIQNESSEYDTLCWFLHVSTFIEYIFLDILQKRYLQRHNLTRASQLTIYKQNHKGTTFHVKIYIFIIIIIIITIFI